MPRDLNFDGVRLLSHMVRAGFLTLLHNQLSNKERVQVSLIWVASINLNVRYQLLPPVVLHPFSKGWQMDEETVIATMQIRMQSLRLTENRSTCTLADLRPGVFAHPNTANLQVALPPITISNKLHQLPMFHLQQGADLLPGTLAVGDAKSELVSVVTGGVFRAAEGQSRWSAMNRDICPITVCPLLKLDGPT